MPQSLSGNLQNDLAWLTVGAARVAILPFETVYEAATGKVSSYDAALIGAQTTFGSAGPALKIDAAALGASANAAVASAAQSPYGNGATYGVIVAVAILGIFLWAVRAGHVGPHSFFHW